MPTRSSGLKDKNGKEICEGDTCRRLAYYSDYENQVLGKIKFQDAAFVFVEKEHAVLLRDFITIKDFTCLEIIGYTFQNAELVN